MAPAASEVHISRVHGAFRAFSMVEVRISREHGRFLPISLTECDSRAPRSSRHSTCSRQGGLRRPRQEDPSSKYLTEKIMFVLPVC